MPNTWATICNLKPAKVSPKIGRLGWITRLLLFILIFVRMLSLEILNPEDHWIFSSSPKTWWDEVFMLFPCPRLVLQENEAQKDPERRVRLEQTLPCCWQGLPAPKCKGKSISHGNGDSCIQGPPGNSSSAAGKMENKMICDCAVIIGGALVKTCLQVSPCGPTCLFWFWALGEEINRFWSREK